MTEKRFSDILRSAVNGESGAVNTILEQYMPLVNSKCFVDGKFDEDCRQHILLHIAKNISKFKF